MKKNLELIHLEYLNIRQPILDANQKRKLKYLTRGYQGEAEFLLWLKKLGSDHVKVISNYWFNAGKTMESDFLIMTEEKWYTIDVKNFDGFFEYKNNECWLNNWLMDENFVMNMSTRIRKLQRIAHEVDPNIKVIGAMVFINEHNEVKINGEVDFDIVLRNQLKHYISNINQPYPFDLNLTQKTASVLEGYRTTSPFRPKGLAPLEFNNLRRGITCQSCYHFTTNISRKNIHCLNCKHTVTKIDSVYEAARQLRYIFCDNPEMITVKNVTEFMGNAISRRTVLRSLTDKCQKVSNGKSTYYHIDIN